MRSARRQRWLVLFEFMSKLGRNIDILRNSIEDNCLTKSIFLAQHSTNTGRTKYRIDQPSSRHNSLADEFAKTYENIDRLQLEAQEIYWIYHQDNIRIL